MEKKTKGTQIPNTEVSEVTSSRPKKKKTITCLVIALFVILFICIGFVLVFLFVKGKVENISDDVTVIIEEMEEESTMDDPADMSGKWAEVLEQSGTGSKDTKYFNIQKDSVQWSVLYTFNGESVTDTISIDKRGPEQTYEDIIVDQADEGDTFNIPVIDGRDYGTFYFKVNTSIGSDWTITVREKRPDNLTPSLHSLSGKWVDVLTGSGKGDQETETFIIDSDSLGWEVVYTFVGSSEDAILNIERVSESSMEYNVVSYAYEGGSIEIPTIDGRDHGMFYLKISTDELSSWTVEVKQLIGD